MEVMEIIFIALATGMVGMFLGAALMLTAIENEIKSKSTLTLSDRQYKLAITNKE